MSRSDFILEGLTRKYSHTWSPELVPVMAEVTTSHRGGKLNSYTIAFKIASIDYHKDGHSKEATSRYVGVDPKRIREWVKNEEKLREALNHQVSGSKSKRRKLEGGGRKPMSQTLEEMLVEYIEDLRYQKLRVTRNIQCKSEELFKKDEVAEDADREIFCARKGWVYRFFKRNNITIRKKTAQDSYSFFQGLYKDYLLLHNTLDPALF